MFWIASATCLMASVSIEREFEIREALAIREAGFFASSFFASVILAVA